MNTDHPRETYRTNIERYRRLQKEAKKALWISSLVRLSVFLFIGLGVYLLYPSPKGILLCLAFGIALFLYLVNRHTALSYKREFYEKLGTINKKELGILDRAFQQLPDGSQYHSPAHPFSQDIDLFGKGSFFQYVNRTALPTGSDFLAALFLSNDLNSIEIKQEAIKELSEWVKWRQEFEAMAALVKVEMPAQRIVLWMQEYQSFLPRGLRTWLYVFSGISILGIIGYFADFLSGYFATIWLFVGLTISGRYIKKVNQLNKYTSKTQSTFEQYYKLLHHIEQQEMQSKMLLQKKRQIISPTHSASGILQQFSKSLELLDQRNNMLIGFLGNGFFLKDLWHVLSLERWVLKHKEHVSAWFEVIAFFDAYISLGNYTYNHPRHTFPLISETDTLLETEGLSHPLLPIDRAVPSDVKVKRKQFFIVTGANMAGKSTFLRTVGLHIMMANTGLPVCAKKSVYTPIKLITSMRTTDSLADDESYFFSELKRLKFIVDSVKTSEYFIILDEILKGTNSTDKAIGSQKFVEKLVLSKSTGIIATHDLSLTKVADALPEVENYFFDARIENDELYFDYLFKKGICQNMNASFLLKKMEIVD